MAAALHAKQLALESVIKPEHGSNTQLRPEDLIELDAPGSVPKPASSRKWVEFLVLLAILSVISSKFVASAHKN